MEGMPETLGENVQLISVREGAMGGAAGATEFPPKQERLTNDLRKARPAIYLGQLRPLDHLRKARLAHVLGKVRLAECPRKV